MVQQVLAFSRGASRRRLEVEIGSLIRDVEKIARDTFFKHIVVTSRVPDDLWRVMGDPTQLHQLLLNLCVNARDAMPDGGVLAISAENLMLDAIDAVTNAEILPGPYLFLQIEDTGVGISSEIIEQIFEPFFTTKEVGKGTGLGLSTSLGIIKSHSGFIRVESRAGQGSRFKIYLPAKIESPVSEEREQARELPRGHGELLLVVDDEAPLRQVAKQMLETFGYQVVAAADGAEAVGIFAQRQDEIAAVITDINMPRLDGPAMIKVLQQMKPTVRVIAASGLTTSAQVAKVTALGVKHVLPKPYTADALLRELRHLLTTPR